jgi:hypothetical protein
MKVQDAKMLDIENPTEVVEITVKNNGTVVWINVDGVCLLRICQIKCPISIEDFRLYKEET